MQSEYICITDKWWIIIRECQNFPNGRIFFHGFYVIRQLTGKIVTNICDFVNPDIAIVSPLSVNDL